MLNPNGLELSCPAEVGSCPLIVAPTGGPGAPPFPPARRVSFSELLGGAVLALQLRAETLLFMACTVARQYEAFAGRLSAPVDSRRCTARIIIQTR